MGMNPIPPPARHRPEQVSDWSDRQPPVVHDDIPAGERLRNSLTVTFWLFMAAVAGWIIGVYFVHPGG